MSHQRPTPSSAAPAVSVIIPTFDRLPMLRQAMESVRAQTWTDWELIVVDDGSTDGTAKYLESVADSRVRVLTIPHCGIPARVRNAALALARGEYIAFLDSDDLWPPEKLGLQLEALQAVPFARWSYTDYSLIDERGSPAPRRLEKPWVPYSGRILPQLVCYDAAVAMPTVLVDRVLMAELGGFDDTMRVCEDYDLWFRLAERADVLAIDRPLASVRHHPARMVLAPMEMDRAWLRICESVLDRVGDPAVRRACRREAARRAWRVGRWNASRGHWRMALPLVTMSLINGIRSGSSRDAMRVFREVLGISRESQDRDVG